jgi:peptide/nickel transport system substrate-binding protein
VLIASLPLLLNIIAMKGEIMRITVSLAITVLVVLSFLLACAAPAPTAAPTKPAAPAATTAPAPAVATSAPAVATKPAAAAPTVAPVAKIKRGGTLRVGMQNDWMGFDPPITQGIFSSAHMIFDSLTRWREGQDGLYSAIPGLAETWDLQGKTATFKLRKGVKFHDGSEFNAKVAKWNVDRMVSHPKSRIKNSLVSVDSVEAVDDYTLRINLKAPMAPLTALLSQGQAYIASQSGYDKIGAEEFNRKPIGSGPFTFVEWQPANQVVVKRYENYWEMGADGKSLPYLDSVVYRLLSDDTIRALDLKAGNIDFTERLAAKDVASLKASPDLVLVDAKSGAMAYRVGFNTEKEPFKNLKLRQAVAWAIDQEAIAKVLGAGIGEPTTYHLLPGNLGYDEKIPGYRLNPAKAKQSLVEAGLPDGADVTLISHNRQLDMQQAQMMKQMLDAVNIRTTIEVGERTANVQKREAGNFQFTALVSTGSVDPDSVYTPNLACGNVGNWTRYCSQEFDKCLEDGRTNYDSKQRHEIYKRCEAILLRDVPDFYFWKLPFLYGINKKVQGFVLGTPELFEFRGVWLN